MLLLQLIDISLHQLVLGLFWMLVHSLWQGLIIAAIAFILLHIFKSATSNVRYGTVASCLLLFVLITASTFFLELRQASNSTIAITSVSTNSAIEFKAHTSVITDASKKNFSTLADNLANKYAYYLVLTWFICYVFYAIRFISGLFYINRLSSHTLPADETWRSNLIRLQNALKIYKKIRVFNSERVQVPVIIGAFKPIILIPVAVANQLPLAEVEAILLHELAHIKRNDFLINLIQTLIDQIFFFNPAVRWMSARIRDEREKCCDDMVLNHSAERDAYINALVRFQESIVANPAFEMALGGNKFQLFKRIRRIINKDNSKSTFMDKTIFFFSILSIAALGFMSGNITTQTPQVLNKVNGSAIVKRAHVHQSQLVQDTIPDKKEKVEAENTRKGSKMKVDQETKEQIEQIRKEMELKRQAIMDEKLKLEHQMNEYKLMNQDQKMAQKDQMEQLMKMKEGQLNEEKINLELKQMNLQQQVFEKELQRKVEALNKEREHMNVDEQKDLDEKLMELNKEAEIKKAQMQNEMAFLENRKNQQIEQQMKMQRDQMVQMKMELQRNRRTSVGQGNPEVDEILSTLLESKIIENTDPISFKLDSHRLIVNDKKQGQEIFNKLKERFIHNSGDFIEYSHHGGSTSTTIHKD